ncbi:hypothetical protein L1887_12738 [Cichorium endivia]|nr:hypothetical protein L1887_12738 [Cichorium endivia]
MESGLSDTDEGVSGGAGGGVWNDDRVSAILWNAISDMDGAISGQALRSMKRKSIKLLIIFLNSSAAKLLSFAQQRARALCILSGNGSVSAVTLRQFSSSGGTITYEGRFEILCLSGGRLIASSLVQLVALMDARKLIEKEMERFKICEKETKTKSFSKEGLGQQPKTDPKEKAKSETRDWLNNTVSELESQIDSFEVEMEGLSIKKGKARPPRLTHLESSITRHKAHIMKLELILRLLDNDELSPEQVNDVKDFLDDYVERNQDDFDDFDDVDMLYNILPLDKVESLEDLVAIGPPGTVKRAVATTAVLSIKSTLSSSVQSPV